MYKIYKKELDLNLLYPRFIDEILVDQIQNAKI